MNRIAAASAALLATTALAQAGGLDRSGLGISPIFEDGTYVELSFGSVMPSVSGTAAGQSSGNMAQDYTNYSFAVRSDLTDRLSYAVLYEQAFGASVDYRNADASYPLILGLQGNSFTAELTGTALTAMLRYELNDRFSVYGGLRYVTMSAEIVFDDVPQTLTYGKNSDLGYLVGAAFEIPEIALRASLTYNSETQHNNAISNSLPINVGLGPAEPETGAYSLPRSVNLDFQTGIAEGTLLLAGVRWAEWTETTIATQSALSNISHDNDSFTYSLGLARRLTEDFAILARVSYEAGKGGTASNLSPTDGATGLSVAGIYDVGNARITAGVNYTVVGDTITDAPVSASFTNNNAWGFGLRVGFSF